MKNYFNEPAVLPHVMQYLSYKDRKCPHALELRSKIMVEVAKIVSAIIFRHKFTTFMHYDDLYQEGCCACLMALDKWNPDYVNKQGKRTTLFNYFSLVTKRCLTFTTLRDKAKRSTANVDDSIDLEAKQSAPDDIMGFLATTRQIFKKLNFRPQYQKVMMLFESYLTACGLFNKRDFFRYCRGHKITSNRVRRFLAGLKKYRSLYE
jgi:hypothetical protein